VEVAAVGADRIVCRLIVGRHGVPGAREPFGAPAMLSSALRNVASSLLDHSMVPLLGAFRLPERRRRHVAFAIASENIRPRLPPGGQQRPGPRLSGGEPKPFYILKIPKRYWPLV
jgi:hypothetical protein